MSPARPNGGARHHADFIHRFTAREAQRRAAQQRKIPLTPEQRARRRERLRQIPFIKPADADSTQINLAGILRKWKR